MATALSIAESSPSGAGLPALIAGRLRGAILTGALAAGTRLNQDRIAAEHGVSHIPVREALRSLEAEGLVTFAPRRGFFVARLSAWDAAEYAEMRGALEGLAVRFAVARAGVSDWTAAERAIAAAEATDDLATWSARNWDFHRALYAPARRPRLLETIEGLWRNADRYLRVAWAAADWQGRSQDDHRAILAAFRRRDAAGAERLVAAHVMDATRAVVEALAAERRE